MNNYADFDPYLNRERREDLRREVSASRLEKRLSRNRERAGSRPGDLARAAALPLFRRTRLSGGYQENEGDDPAW